MTQKVDVTSRGGTRPQLGRGFIALGIALIILGAIGATSTVFLSIAIPVVVGPILMTSGILQVLLALFTQPWRGSSLHLMAAALDMVVGLLILTHPAQATDELILVLVVYLMAGGLYRVFGSLLLRLPAWGWALAAGMVPLLLGVILWQVRPFHGLWFFGLCVAVDLLCHGASWLVFSQALRSPLSADAESPPPPALVADRAAHAGGKGQGVRELLHQLDDTLVQQTKALEHVDELIHRAESKEREVYGEKGPTPNP
jgi:uncharacterized membrane protein HdeD (DUF308 family)